MATLDFHKALDAIAQNIVGLGAGPTVAMSRSEFIEHSAAQLAQAASEPPEIRAARLAALAQSVQNARTSTSDTVQVHLFDAGENDLLDDIARALMAVHAAINARKSGSGPTVAKTAVALMPTVIEARATKAATAPSKETRKAPRVATSRQLRSTRIASDEPEDDSLVSEYDSPEWDKIG